MNIKYLEEFRTLAELCNYQEAAEQLYVSQSTLSKHISKMEQELGVLLFDRTTRNVALTAYGKLLAEYAARITAAYDDFTAEINAMQQEDGRHLTIGFSAPLTQYGILEFVSDFIHSYPGIHVSMTECANPTELLRSKKCDIAFDAQYVPDAEKYNSERDIFAYDSLVAVVSKNNPIARQKSVAVSDLRDEKFILKYNSVGTMTQVFRKACMDAGFAPKIVCSVSYSSAMAKLASEDIGIAILHRKHLQDNLTYDVAVVDIEPTIHYNIYVHYSDSKENLSSIHSFRKFYQIRKH